MGGGRNQILIIFHRKFNLKTTTNIGLALWRLKCFYETFPATAGQVVQGSTVVISYTESTISIELCAKKIRHIGLAPY